MDRILKILLGLAIFCLPLSMVFIFDAKILAGSKWQYGTGQFFLAELFLLAFIALAGVKLITAKKLTFKKINWQTLAAEKSALLTLSLWLFLGWAGLSLIWSAEKSAAYYLWLKWLEGGALFILLPNLKFNKKIILWPLVAAGLLQSLLAIKQFVSQIIPANKLLGIAEHSAGSLGDIVIEFADERWLRAYGSLPHPNILGGFLVLSLIALLIIGWQSYRPKQPALIGITAIISAGLFFSFSRSAWLALILILTLLIIAIGKKITVNFNYFKKLKPAAVIIITLMTLTVIYWPLVYNRSNLSQRLENKSVQERLSQNQTAIGIIKNHLLLGVGLNNYTYYQWQKNQPLLIQDSQPVHNIFLLLTAELGIIGVLLFIVLLMAALNYSFWRFTPLQLAPLLLIIAIGLFDHYLLTQFSGIMIFWLALFLLINRERELT